MTADLVVGSLALLVEGLFFFLLNEPDTVSRMGYIGKYLAALFSGWMAVMSTASLILIFIPLLFPASFKTSSVIPAGYIWGAAAICFAIANFGVWKQVQVAVEVLQTRPDIKGSVTYLKFGGMISVGFDRQSRPHVSTEVRFGVYLINRTNVATNLQKIILDGSSLDPPIEFQELPCRNVRLEFGMGQKMDQLLIAATLHGFSRADKLPPIKLDKLKAYAVDGFRKWHWLSVSDLKEASFPE